jgi:hypothetical protein
VEYAFRKAVTNSCAQGQQVRKFINGLLAKNISADKEVWARMTDQHKELFWASFSEENRPKLSKPAQAVQDKINVLVEILKNTAVQSNTIKIAVKAELKLLRAALKKFQPSITECPVITYRHGYCNSYKARYRESKKKS